MRSPSDHPSRQGRRCSQGNLASPGTAGCQPARGNSSVTFTPVNPKRFHSARWQAEHLARNRKEDRKHAKRYAYVLYVRLSFMSGFLCLLAARLAPTLMQPDIPSPRTPTTQRPIVNRPMTSVRAFTGSPRRTRQRQHWRRTSPSIVGSSVHLTESRSYSYGLPILRILLSTPPHGDAVGIGYGGGCRAPDKDLHLAVDVRCWAHDHGL